MAVASVPSLLPASKYIDRSEYHRVSAPSSRPKHSVITMTGSVISPLVCSLRSPFIDPSKLLATYLVSTTDLPLSFSLTTPVRLRRSRHSTTGSQPPPQLTRSINLCHRPPRSPLPTTSIVCIPTILGKFRADAHGVFGQSKGDKPPRDALIDSKRVPDPIKAV